MKLSYCLVAIVTAITFSLSIETVSAQCGGASTTWSHQAYHQPIPQPLFNSYQPIHVAAPIVSHVQPVYYSVPSTNYRPIVVQQQHSISVTRPVQAIPQVQPAIQSYFPVMPASSSACANGQCHLNQ